MKNHFWSCITFTLLSGLANAADYSGVKSETLQLLGLDPMLYQSIENTNDGGLLIIRKDQSEIYLSPNEIEFLKTLKGEQAPKFENSKPCIARRD